MASFNKKPNYEIRICSKNLTKYLIQKWKIPSGAKSQIIRIPKKIMRSNIKTKQSFLRGVIDGDGSISKRGIKIASGSSLFLEDLKVLLDDINIHSGSIIKERETTFTIRINKYCDLLKMKVIYSNGSCYPRKKISINKV